MDVIHPNLRQPQQVIGVIFRNPVAKSFTYDVGKKLTFSPKGNDVTVVLAGGGAEAIVLAGSTITITYVVAASTLASLQALLAGDPPSAALVSLIGDAGTIPAGFTGGTRDLWVDTVIPPSLMCVVDDDGNVVPFSGKSISISVTVVADDENAYDYANEDLNGAAAVDKLVFSGDIRSFAVLRNDGTATFKYDAVGDPAVPAISGLSWDKMKHTKVYVSYPGGEGAGKLLQLVIGKKV